MQIIEIETIRPMMFRNVLQRNSNIHKKMHERFFALTIRRKTAYPNQYKNVTYINYWKYLRYVGYHLTFSLSICTDLICKYDVRIKVTIQNHYCSYSKET